MLNIRESPELIVTLIKAGTEYNFEYFKSASLSLKKSVDLPLGKWSASIPALSGIIIGLFLFPVYPALILGMSSICQLQLTAVAHFAGVEESQQQHSESSDKPYIDGFKCLSLSSLAQRPRPPSEYVTETVIVALQIRHISLGLM